MRKMNPTPVGKWVFVALLGLALAVLPSLALAENEIVATLERITGPVDVMQSEKNQKVPGKNGLLLHAGDTVSTSETSQATIKFRDGSEIRIFPRTVFKVEMARESQGKNRNFKYNLNMKVGSFWGSFTKQRQAGTISTPTATIGIKGTTLRVLDRDNKAQIALSEGEIEVKNDKGTVDLSSGKRIASFGPRDDLSKKVGDIPYKLDAKSEVTALNFEKGQAEAFVSIQVVNVKNGQQFARSGPLYFRSNYDKVVFPADVALNERGFARVALKFNPPEAGDSELQGNIYVWAVMDREADDDVGEGRVLFTFPIQSDKTIQINADSGEGKRVK